MNGPVLFVLTLMALTPHTPHTTPHLEVGYSEWTSIVCTNLDGFYTSYSPHYSHLEVGFSE